MNELPDLERRGRAYRAAGTAVARYIQGRPPIGLALDGPGPEEGEARRDWPVDLGSRARSRLEQEILMSWVGLLAQSRSCRDDEEPPGGWGAAAAPLAELGRRVTRSDAENEAYLEWLRRRARGLLDLPGIWPAVEALADALIERGRVAPEEASALIARTQQARRRRSGIGGWLRNVR